MLVGIENYRAAAARLVRSWRDTDDDGFEDVDIDVSIFDGAQAVTVGVDRKEHRRLACDARAELWRNMRADCAAIDDDDQIQVFEEMSHTE